MQKTESEIAFEQFCTANAVCWEPIPTEGPAGLKTPGYLIYLGGTSVAVEVKEVQRQCGGTRARATFTRERMEHIWRHRRGTCERLDRNGRRAAKSQSQGSLPGSHRDAQTRRRSYGNIQNLTRLRWPFLASILSFSGCPRICGRDHTCLIETQVLAGR